MSILYAVLVLGIMGLLFGLILAFASKIFAVEVDERIPLVQECLPGANCGGCGFPGCNGLATAIVEGRAPINGCPVGGAPCAAKIAEVLGVEADASEKLVAHVACSGNCDNVKNRATYEGIKDCAGAMRVTGGFKDCSFACIGLGTCERACPFDSIHVVNGVAVVDEEKCKACKKCVNVCPKRIIDMVPAANPVRIDCSSQDKGKDVMDVCKVGCIGCSACVRACKFDAIHMEGNLPKIDYDKCKRCQMCAKACPRHIIEPWHTPEQIQKLAEMKAKQAAAKKAAAEKAKAVAAAKTGEEAKQAELATQA